MRACGTGVWTFWSSSLARSGRSRARAIRRSGSSRTPWRLGDLLERWAPDTVHLATEGPLGLAARAYLTRRRLSFTTSLHTKFPEYVSARLPVPVDWGYAYLRWFHRPAAPTLVTTESHRRELEDRDLSDLVVWGRGVDTELFRPMPRAPRRRPRLLYVGRVAVEKNVEAFLELDVDAEKIVVGDGPQRAELERRHPSARWLGYRRGPALVRCYADADVFVFPSRTDTFGLVMLEAMACGTPVAAYPVTGPVDVVTPATGALAEDLGVAVARAVDVDRGACRRHAVRCDWQAIADRMRENLIPVSGTRRPPFRTPSPRVTSGGTGGYSSSRRENPICRLARPPRAVAMLRTPDTDAPRLEARGRRQP